MTLPVSGAISLTDVMTELRLSNAGRAYPISLGDTDVRSLFGVASGAIGLTSGYGKSSYVPMTLTGTDGYASSDSSLASGSSVCGVSIAVSGGSGGLTYTWSVVSQSGGCYFGTNGASTYTVGHTYTKQANGTAQATLSCSVSDNTGHTVVLSTITANMDWSGTM